MFQSDHHVLNQVGQDLRRILPPIATVQHVAHLFEIQDDDQLARLAERAVRDAHRIAVSALARDDDPGRAHRLWEEVLLRTVYLGLGNRFPVVLELEDQVAGSVVGDEGVPEVVLGGDPRDEVVPVQAPVGLLLGGPVDEVEQPPPGGPGL